MLSQFVGGLVDMLPIMVTTRYVYGVRNFFATFFLRGVEGKVAKKFLIEKSYAVMPKF
jgi:hypothetical protein